MGREGEGEGRGVWVQPSSDHQRVVAVVKLTAFSQETEALLWKEGERGKKIINSTSFTIILYIYMQPHTCTV